MSTKINVLQVIPKLGYGGAETGCYDIAHYLAEKECGSFIATASGGLLKFVKKEKNELLMCRSVVQGDCTLRVPAEINQLPGNKTVPDYRKGKIRNIQALTHDVISFDIDIDIPMTYEAGQFVVIEAPEVTGGRAYSMVNYDTQTNILSFVIKRKPEGDFSDWLFENNVEGLELKYLDLWEKQHFILKKIKIFYV